MIMVFGDGIRDRYNYYSSTGKIDPHLKCPVVKHSDICDQAGGALAVQDMVQALGHDVCSVTGHNDVACHKVRAFLDNQPLFRHDTPMAIGEIDSIVNRTISDNVPINLILVADYGCGMVTKARIDYLSQIAPVIADTHPSRPMSTYDSAWGIVTTKKDYRLSNHDYLCITDGPNGLVSKAVDVGELRPGIYRKGFRDSCGAGDQVLATIGVALANGIEWVEACRLANIVASIQVTKFGTEPVTLEELRELEPECHAKLTCSVRSPTPCND